MLAVVQMVYPTIKSGARLCREIPCFREIQTRRTPNGVGEQAGKGREGRNRRKARRPAPIVEAFRSLAHCISSSFSWVACLSHSSFLPPYADFLMKARRPPSLILPPLCQPPNGPSHEWPKEEMCLCLDFRQIICGNKFLCVQCHVIGFISRATGSLPRVYLTLYLSIRGERTIDNRKKARYGACWIAVVVRRAREEWIGGHLPEKSTP